ncbi:MAG TPA: S8 family serine peptidase, partial [Gammaproteobacteria bacterium]|nr:S8 family serine peptidase [Gammaproteobacteria bacterium]
VPRGIEPRRAESRMSRRKPSSSQRPVPCRRVWLRAGAILVVNALLPWIASASEPGVVSRLQAAARAVCEGSEQEDFRIAEALGGAILLERMPLTLRGQNAGTRHRYMLKNGARVSLEEFAPGQKLQRLTLVYHADDQGERRAEWMVIANGDCRPLTGRRLVYDGPGAPIAIERTDASLERVEAREHLNPPVPEGAPVANGVPVALVDSGVNYLLGDIRRRLARDSGGEILGYDYWDMDSRPFDSHPARSPFFPQRHGTQTAGVIIADAPVATLVPYRYPRPEMSRMGDLVEHAAASGVRIVNLSLGGRDAEEWRAFAEAARRHPEILFVASAGNEGRDIDEERVYPAALGLANLITATSASDNGLPAQGSNWGAGSVDLLVPAEEQLSIDFYGRPRLVSGSSYASARVSALAACLLAANPTWRAPELKEAIYARVKPSVNDVMRFVSKGFLDEPTLRERGACPGEPKDVTVLSEKSVEKQTLYSGSAFPESVEQTLSLSLVVLDGTAWSEPLLESMAAEAARILAQCGLGLSDIRLYRVRAPRRLSYFNDWHASALVSKLEIPRPAVFFVRDTLQQIAFDAEAIGHSNGRSRPSLVDTVWMTEAVGHSGIALAHELFHVLADSGNHSDDPENLMYAETLGVNTRLNEGQCMQVRRTGTAFGHLKPLQ